MTADIIQARYDQLDNIANRFGREAENTTALMQQVQRGVDALRQSGWEGQGAVAFLGEMETAVFPVIQRLTNAFEEASTTTQTLRDIIRTAEEEAASLFQGRNDVGDGNSGWLPSGAGEAYGFGGSMGRKGTNNLPSAGTSSTVEAQALIKKHTKFGLLDEEGLAKDLLARMKNEPRQGSALFETVMQELPAYNRDDVSLAILQQASDQDIKDIASTQEGREALLHATKHLEEGWTDKDTERLEIHRTMNLITSVAPSYHSGQPVTVQVITFETGAFDNPVIGGRGHTALVIGGYVYSFEGDWTGAMTIDEYLAKNTHRTATVQTLNISEQDALALQKQMNNSLSGSKIWGLSGDVCVDASAKELEKIIPSLEEPGWDPQKLPQILERGGHVKETQIFPETM